MPTPQRLPIVGSDNNTWGDILVQYLQLQHVNSGTDSAGNGGHQNVTITPGTSSQPPLQLSSGTLVTTPVAGSVEFNSNTYYMTTSTPTRKTVAIYDDSSGAAGDTYYRDASGNFVRLGVGSSGQVLTVSGTNLPSWQPASGGGLGNSFETVSQNLSAYPKTLNYTSGVLTSITYTVGSNTITKTLNYTSGVLTSIVLSGTGLPSISAHTKTLTYTSGVLTSIAYS